MKYHQLAFNNVCSFIDNNIIDNKKCYFFTSLCDCYVEILKKSADEDGNKYDNVFSKTHFENKLKERYGDYLKSTIIHNKKIIAYL